MTSKYLLLTLLYGYNSALKLKKVIIINVRQLIHCNLLMIKLWYRNTERAVSKCTTTQVWCCTMDCWWNSSLLLDSQGLLQCKLKLLLDSQGLLHCVVKLLFDYQGLLWCWLKLLNGKSLLW